MTRQYVKRKTSEEVKETAALARKRWRINNREHYNELCYASQRKIYQWKKIQRIFLNILLPDEEDTRMEICTENL